MLSEALLMSEPARAAVGAVEQQLGARVRMGAVGAGTSGRRAHRWVTTPVFVALLGVAALVALATVPTLLGYRTFIVYGGSMGSGLETGSVAVTSPIDPAQLEVGDVVARSDGSARGLPILHRVVAVGMDDGDLSVTTKGDANAAADPEPLTREHRVEQLVYSVPYAGYVLHHTGSELGRLLLIGVPSLLLIVPPLWNPRRSGDDRPAGRQSTSTARRGPTVSTNQRRASAAVVPPSGRAGKLPAARCRPRFLLTEDVP